MDNVILQSIKQLICKKCPNVCLEVDSLHSARTACFGSGSFLFTVGIFLEVYIAVERPLISSKGCVVK